MRRVLAGFLVMASLESGPAALGQDGLVEERFHRVHLKNGNFIDGTLARQNEKEVILLLRHGEVAIKADLVDRIEFVKIRTLNEAPKEVPRPKTTPVENRSETAPKPIPITPEKPPENPASRRTPAPFEAGPAIRQKVEEILELTEKALPNEKFKVMKALYEVGKEAAPYLAAQLETFDAEIMSYAAMILCQMKEPSCLPIVTRFLESKDPHARSHAATVIGTIGGPENASDLHPLLKDPESPVRSAVLSSLQQLGNRASFEAITPLCLDPEKMVRRLAVGVLFELAEKHGLKDDVAAVFTEALDRAKGEAPVELLNAISQTGKKNLWNLLTPYLTDESPKVRAAAANAIGNLGAQEAVPAIVSRMAAEPEKWVNIQLFAAAQRLKAMTAMDALIAGLGDSDADVKAAASRALREITGQNFGDDPEKWAAWWEATKPRQ